MLLGMWMFCLNVSAQESQRGSVIVCVEQQMTRSVGSPLLQKAEVLMEIHTDTEEISARSSKSKQVLMELTVEHRSTESLIQELQTYPEVVFVEENREIYAQNISDYPDFSNYQWACQNEGQQSGNVGVDIGYEQWNQSSATEDAAVIAVLDTGIDYTHPDLENKMWHKSANEDWKSLPGGEYGWNICKNDTNGNPYSGVDIMDDNWHGTHCSGTIAAAWDQHGISGIAENVELMGVKILNDQSKGMLSDAIRAYDYLRQACNLGVNIKVINNSWGDDVPSKSIDYAVRELGRLGVISVFAAGNDGKNLDEESDMTIAMKDNPYALIVNAITPDGTMASFSNYSATYTDVAAPGTGILSTVPLNKSQYLAELAKENLFYRDFDTDLSSFSFFSDGEIVGKRTTEVNFNGNYSMQLPIKGKKAVFYTEAIVLKQSSAQTYISMHLLSDTQDDVYVKLWVKNKNGDWIPVSDLFSDAVIRFGVWGKVSQALPEDTDYNKFQLKIEFNTYADSYPENIFIDAMGIGTECYPYDYADGTSMAAPIVTAQVAILSQMYGEEADCLAARIIGSAVMTNALENKNSANGFVNMSNINHPRPIIQRAEQTQKEYLEMEGYFWKIGGTITMDDTPLEVLWWSEHSIIVRLPQNIKKHLARIVVSLDEDREEEISVLVETEQNIPELSYRTHVQNIGWQSWVENGVMAGTKGRSLRVEAIEIIGTNLPEESSIVYRTHVQNIGWQPWVENGAMAGTKGRSLRIEAIQIKLTGELEKRYNIVYRTHVQNIGWQSWVENGAMAGTKGQSLRVEAIQIKLEKK
ncbi:Thermophilic serine proteinase precursor [Clostridiales bacterium CHKCI001]|nr:Thermophilic serine proteinase precursor [Clostridiales bacterium CHKCI001]